MGYLLYTIQLYAYDRSLWSSTSASRQFNIALCHESVGHWMSMGIGITTCVCTVDLLNWFVFSYYNINKFGVKMAMNKPIKSFSKYFIRNHNHSVSIAITNLSPIKRGTQIIHWPYFIVQSGISHYQCMYTLNIFYMKYAVLWPLITLNYPILYIYDLAYFNKINKHKLYVMFAVRLFDNPCMHGNYICIYILCS